MSHGPEKKELKAQWPVETDVQEYTAKDVAKHNAKSDMWITIHGKVYDVTEYLRDHPGGADALIDVGGQDATVAYEDVGHSEDATEILQSFLVGSIKGAKDAPKKESTAVRVVRKDVMSAAPPKTTWPSPAYVGALALIFGGSTLVYNNRSARAIVAGMEKQLSKLGISKLPNLHLGNHGFAQGVIVATALCGLFSLVTINKISAGFKITSGAMRYPPIKLRQKIINHSPAGFLKAKEYQSLPLVKKEYLSDSVIRLVFELPKKDTIIGLPIGQHVAIKAQVGETMVTRSYTPTSNNSDRGILELVVRIYPDGLITNGYLSNLQVGDDVDFRGPKGAMRYRKGYAKFIGMIAGGTGITPMFQIIRAICEDDTDLTKISLIYANRSESDILLRDRLDRFAKAYPKNFKVFYMLDSPSEGWKGGRGYVTKDVMAEHLPASSEDNKMMLCGPPPMVNACKKSLVDLGWKAPGAVGKFTDHIFCF